VQVATYATYFGGSSSEVSAKLDVGADGRVYVAASTFSLQDFPVTNRTTTGAVVGKRSVFAVFSSSGKIWFS
jgi:hypothetical protein